MKYHIDTIPVWDAYKAEGECPLCDLEAQNEQMYVESFLGASVMEPAVRIEVNEKGFCGPHFAMMFSQKNRLGLALMTHTHLQESMKSLGGVQPQKKGLFAKKNSTPDANVGDTCILCERLRTTMDRYLFTVLHLWKTDSAFKAALEGGKGHCLPHYHKLAQMAAQELPAGQGAEFIAMLDRVQEENMARIEKELEWFTLKFDYRNADAPWGNSRDAVERAINKLEGKCL